MVVAVNNLYLIKRGRQMASIHVHSVKSASGFLTHLYNLQFMSDNEVLVLKNLVDNKPINTNDLETLGSIKSSINKMLIIAAEKNAVARSEREESDKPKPDTTDTTDTTDTDKLKKN